MLRRFSSSGRRSVRRACFAPASPRTLEVRVTLPAITCGKFCCSFTLPWRWPGRTGRELTRDVRPPNPLPPAPGQDPTGHRPRHQPGGRRVGFGLGGNGYGNRWRVGGPQRPPAKSNPPEVSARLLPAWLMGLAVMDLRIRAHVVERASEDRDNRRSGLGAVSYPYPALRAK